MEIKMAEEIGEIGKASVSENIIAGIIGTKILAPTIFDDFINGKGASIQEIDKGTKNLLDKVFPIIDTDKDNRISAAEFDLLVKQFPAEMRQELENNKGMLFKYKDGVSLEELEQERNGLIAKIDKMDKSGDGRVDQSEVEIPMDRVIDTAKSLESPEVSKLLADYSGLPKEEIDKIMGSLQGRIKAGDIDGNDKLSIEELRKVGEQLMSDVSDAKAASELQNPNPELRTK